MRPQSTSDRHTTDPVSRVLRDDDPPIARRTVGPAVEHGQVVGSVERRLSTLVSREEQLALAEALLLESTADCLVVQGESGVGKSRLAEEVLGLARGMGHPVARVTATTCQAPLAALAPLLPTDVVVDDPVSLFQACAARLRSARCPAKDGRGPSGRRLVLLVDDLQRLDEVSSTLLRQLLDAELLLLVATVRLEPGAAHTNHPTPIDCSRTFWLHLEPFTDREVADYLTTMLDGPVAAGSCREFAKLSAGNPQYLRQLLLGALRSGRLHRSGPVWQLNAPPRTTPVLTGMIRNRLTGVEGPARDIVEILACCEPLDLGALAHAVPLGDCAQLEARGIVHVEPAGRRYLCSLAHPLYGEVVRDQLPEVRRQAIYRAQARWLREAGGRRHDDMVRAASFELAAEGVADASALLDAARRARRAEDHRKVLTLLDGIPQETGGFFACLARGEAQHHLGRFEEAEHSFRQAQSRAPDLTRFLDVVLLRTHNAVYGSGSPDVARAITAEALFEGTGREPAQEAAMHRTLRIGEAAAELFRQPMGEVLRLLGEADLVEIPDIRQWATLQRAMALSFTGRMEEALADVALALTGSASPDGARAEPPASGTHLAAWAVVVYIEAGWFAQARTVGEKSYERALRSGSRQFQAVYACQLGRCELISGRLRAAREWFGEAAAALHGLDQPMLEEQTWSGLMAVHAQLGEAEEAEAAATRYRAIQVATPGSGIWRLQSVVARAWVLASTDDLARAQELLDEGVAYLRRRERYVHEGLLLVERARLGAAEEVSGRLAELAEQGGGEPARVRAEVAAAMVSGDGEELLQAARSCEAADLVLLGAETALRASRVFAARGERQAAASARRLGDGLRRATGGARTPGLVHWQGVHTLTMREKEVALMAAEGMSSRGIAERLVLSVRTVENFLQRSYNKMGITSRRDLPRVLADLSD
ncbi:ATP-binding protein [Streptomyces sp. ODS05-4]|uniref:ATP-binding protein n=1 Tax=Streptomyces sp. ODS05-4 TaxID=2944939 RepID=UPI00210CBEEB|nr:LuxR C-terminal-related transcriptional regulator [Streptomyces sp. ODS05-4]